MHCARTCVNDGVVQRGTWFDAVLFGASLDEQLEAIESLAATGSEDALRFLENLYSSHEERVGFSQFYGTIGTQDIGYEITKVVQVYPNATGPLKDALDHVLGMEGSGTGYGGGYLNTDQPYPEDLSAPVHQRLRTALATLKAALRH